MLVPVKKLTLYALKKTAMPSYWRCKKVAMSCFCRRGIKKPLEGAEAVGEEKKRRQKR